MNTVWRCVFVWIIQLGLIHVASAQQPMIAGSQRATFAVDSTGQLWGWGSDLYGELGQGRDSGRVLPKQTTLERYSDVAMGEGHTLAISRDATLYAWGGNARGQLGDGTTQTRGTPIVVGSGYRQVATYRYSSFGIKRDGSLWAWGSNANGQLGDGTLTSRERPVFIGGGYQTIAASADCTLAIKTDATLWIWGYCGFDSQEARRGGATNGARLLPQMIGEGFVNISISETHATAVRVDGTLWAWGSNKSAQLGNGTTVGQTAPIQVGSGYRIAQAGNAFTVAIKTDGTAWSWGDNSFGGLGRGLRGDADGFFYYAAPGRIGSDFVNVSIRNNHCIALKTGGTIWTWGNNPDGRLGDGTTIIRVEPKQIDAGYTTISAGVYGTSGVRIDGTLWQWGRNYLGQLTDPSPLWYSVPTLIGSGFVYVTASRDLWGSGTQVFAIKRGGELWAWGDNRYGQVGDEASTPRSIPAQVGIGYSAVASSGDHTLAVKTDGTLLSWGSNTSGSLGTDKVPINTYNQAHQLIGSDYVSVEARYAGSMGLKKDGTVWTWGSAEYGLLGDGATVDRFTPTIVPTLSSISKISAGSFHSLALKSDGTVWVWGNNFWGQLGDGTSTDQSVPIPVSGLPKVIAVAAGYGMSLALTAEGEVWSWGTGLWGDLGTGLKSSPVPKRVGTGFTAIATGGAHGIAMRSDGSVWGFGYNGWGQLGDGLVADQTVPVPVVNKTAAGYLSLTGADLGNGFDPLRVLTVAGKVSKTITATLTDLRAKGLTGEIYFTALVPKTPRTNASENCIESLCSTRTARPLAANRSTISSPPRRGPLNVMSLSRRDPAADAGGAMMVVSYGRTGVKQSGAGATSESAFVGDISRSGTLSVVDDSVFANSGAVLCIGITIPELSAKGQVLVRPLAVDSGNLSERRDATSLATGTQGVVQCPPVQTSATLAQFKSEVTGSLTSRTMTAVITPNEEDRGKIKKVYSWAVAPDGRQFMQTGDNVWEEMTQPMKPAATITLPRTGTYRHPVTRGLDLSSLVGTLVFIGVGDSWEEVTGLNKAGHYNTVQ